MKSLSTLLILGMFAAMLHADEPEPEKQVYKKIGDDIELQIWIYKPEGWKAEDKRPAIVFYHGGGWNKGTPQQFDPHSRHFAERGMVVFGVEYRLKSKHNTSPTESTLDAKSAFRWVRGHAGELGINPDRIAAGGGSAGGHLAAAIALVEMDDPQDDLSVSAKPNALLLFNPALFLGGPNIVERWGEEGAKKAEAISPHHQLKEGFPPTIIFHGTGDTTVPYHTAEDFSKKAVSLGADVRLRGYDKRAHGFFNHGKGDGKDYESTLAESDAFLVELGWLEAVE